jgi:hypothetical protein
MLILVTEQQRVSGVGSATTTALGGDAQAATLSSQFLVKQSDPRLGISNCRYQTSVVLARNQKTGNVA